MKVLVIDDQPEALRPLAKILQANKGVDGRYYEVTARESHAEALRLLQEETFEIVVTDMVVREREDEGLEIVKALFEKSPITIVFTAYPSIPMCVAVMKAGAWDYLEKTPMNRSDAYENLLRSIEEGCRERLAHPYPGKPDPNTRWAHEHLKDLAEKFPGQVVAIFDEKVVESAPTVGELVERIKDRFYLRKPCLFQVPDPSVEMIE